MGLGVIIALAVVYIQIRITYRDMVYYKFDEPTTAQGMLTCISPFVGLISNTSALRRFKEGNSSVGEDSRVRR